MADTQVLTKILRLRESQKQKAQQIYEQSTQTFEKAGTKLYDLLRQKETAERSYDYYLGQSAQIETIKEQLTYIQRLNEHIVRLQQEVNQARQQMENDQNQLFDAHVEVKKYEKMIERCRNIQNAQMADEDKKDMDEASVQQYLKNR